MITNKTNDILFQSIHKGSMHTRLTFSRANGSDQNLVTATVFGSDGFAFVRHHEPENTKKRGTGKPHHEPASNIEDLLRDKDLVGIMSAIDQGGDPNASDFFGETPLAVAVSYQDADAVRTLIAKGATVNAGNFSLFTPLMEAARLGNGEIVDILIAANVNALAEDEYETTAAMRAREAGHPHIANKIEDYIKNHPENQHVSD